MVFWPPFGLNNNYGGNFKGGCQPVNFEGGVAPSLPTNFAFFDPAHMLWWVPEAFSTGIVRVIIHVV